MSKELPVGVAQQMVLNALGAPQSVNTWDKAKRYFSEIGIIVGAARDGRGSKPWVREDTRALGGWNPGNEDGWSAPSKLTPEQRAALAPWWVE